MKFYCVVYVIDGIHYRYRCYASNKREARKMCVEVDKARDLYQQRYAGCNLDDKRTKHILIDSSLFGIEGTAEFLVDAAKRRFRL